MAVQLGYPQDTIVLPYRLSPFASRAWPESELESEAEEGAEAEAEAYLSQGRYFERSGRKYEPRYRYNWARAKRSSARLLGRPSRPCPRGSGIATATAASISSDDESLAGFRYGCPRRPAGLKRRRPGDLVWWEGEDKEMGEVVEVEEEWRELAVSRDIAVSGEAARAVRVGRPPSLERQEAFWDERTVKRRSTDRDGSSSCDGSGGSDSIRSKARGRTIGVRAARDPAEQAEKHGKQEEEEAREEQEAREAAAVANLYDLGLLYDDDHLRGPGFGLGIIPYGCPAFKLRRRHPERQAHRRKDLTLVKKPVSALPQQLLSSRVGGDCEAVADCLVSPRERGKQISRGLPSPPLTVIYECDHYNGEEEKEEENEQWKEEEDDDDDGNDRIDNKAMSFPRLDEVRSGLGPRIDEYDNHNNATFTLDDTDSDWAILDDGGGANSSAKDCATDLEAETEEMTAGDNPENRITDVADPDSWVMIMLR